MLGNIFGTYDASANPTSGAVGGNVVNGTWIVNENVNGGSDATIKLQWKGTDESSSFDRTTARYGHYTSGAWDLSVAATASGTNPYTLTRTGITTFSPFGIIGQFASCTNSFDTLCVNETFNIDYTAVGTFNAGNIFTAQLSDAGGSFATPVSIGTNASVTSGTISATIPGGTAAGSGYRTRVVSSDVTSTGSDNGIDFMIAPLPTVTITQAGNVLSTSSSFISYQWYKDGTAIGGETNSSLTATGSGVYELHVFNSNGCEGISNSITITGVNELAIGNLQLAVYPNPVSEQLTVELLRQAQHDNYSISIVDVNGKELIHRIANSKTEIINVEALSAGVYFVRVKIDAREMMRKFVK